ncbi:hypothetical protein D9K80_14620 [Acinetobacter cumulans]|uniref:Carboxypeptidase regulatory-like domain-containing protein n=1 Tax=Acinetobacter cumulans TaxID=2136182 RepID=A0A498D895_9GAMM|nr:hypothetical protein [Acinetobacter cumulans]RLL31770.1 hypothetical protein D9K80_14620 [Acinetobacter cumulans]
MKPAELTVKKTCSNNSYLKLDQNIVIAKIQGDVKKLKVKYASAFIVLYNKENLQPITATRPNSEGCYAFIGLNTNLKTFIVGFDNSHQFNAVIQDNVVPK